MVLKDKHLKLVDLALAGLPNLFVLGLLLLQRRQVLLLLGKACKDLL